MKDYFSKKISTIISDCYYKNKAFVSGFLTTQEQEIAKIECRKYPDLLYSFDGGFKNSEYQKLLINTTDPMITILKITYNPKYLNLTHRNLLGGLMHLGIYRDRVGDIATFEGYSYVAVTKNLVNFIIDELSTTYQTPIEITVSNDIIELPDKGIEKTIFISSNRIDAIISMAFGISREESSALFNKEMVKLNQNIITKSFQNVKACDIISVARKGRIKIIDTEGTTKSGRLVFKIKIYR